MAQWSPVIHKVIFKTKILKNHHSSEVISLQLTVDCFGLFKVCLITKINLKPVFNSNVFGIYVCRCVSVCVCIIHTHTQIWLSHTIGVVKMIHLLIYFMILFLQQIEVVSQEEIDYFEFFEGVSIRRGMNMWQQAPFWCLAFHPVLNFLNGSLSNFLNGVSKFQILDEDKVVFNWNSPALLWIKSPVFFMIEKLFIFIIFKLIKSIVCSYIQ